MLPVLTATVGQRGARRAAVALVDARPRPRARRPAAHGRCGLPVAHDPRSGVFRATGRPARRRCTSTPTSRWRSQRYLDWTQDEAFEERYAVPILVETARLWMSLGYLGEDDKFHIDGITGPDEYSAIVRDNIYTNLAAARNLDRRGRRRRALDEVCRRSSMSPTTRSRRGARPPTRVAVPFDDERRRAPAGSRQHRSRGLGLRGVAPRRRLPAAAQVAVHGDLPQAGRQAGRPRAGDALVRRSVHASRRRLAPSSTTTRSPCATRRCRRARRRSWPPRSGISILPPTT